MSYSESPFDPQSSAGPPPEPVEESTEFEEVLDLASDEELEQLDEQIETTAEAERSEAEPEPAQPEDSPEIQRLRAQAQRAEMIEQELARQYNAEQSQEMERLKEEDPQEFYDRRIQSLEQQQAAQQQIAHYERAAATVQQSEARLAETAEDYYDVVESVKDFNRQTLRQNYPQAPAEAIEHQVSQNAQSFALRALQSGADPATAAYQYGKQFIAAMQQQGQPTSQPAQPQRQPGRQATRPRMTSLSGVAGRSSGGGRTKLTSAQVANLDLDDPGELELFERAMASESNRAALDRDGVVYL